jgi:hypothetical protein
MKITIKWLDYSATLDGSNPLVIERKLNEPSICQLALILPVNGSLATPARNQALAVMGDDGTVYFTGYIAATPMPEFVGMAMEGPRWRIAIQAVSDEILLDQLLMPPSVGTTGLTAGELIAALVTRTGCTALSTHLLTLNTPVSNFALEPGASWSKSAGTVANEARSAYRAVNGALQLVSIPGVVHSLDETSGSLNPANLTLTSSLKRALANDATVCGEHEPVAYVTEYFLGDGATTQFYLAADPFFPASGKTSIIHEQFNESQIDTRVWSNLSSPGYLALGPAGLVMNGGNGIDGQTVLSWLDSVEMGGTLLLEATGVTLAAGSTGVLAGFFAGLDNQAGCVAGFAITAQQGTGAVTLQPLVMGSASGSTFAVNAAIQYALRVRVHCPENERQLAQYNAVGDNGAITYGGQANNAPGKLQMEIQQYVNGVAAMPVTLYDGAIASLPQACTVVAASSINLVGSMRALNLTNLGSGWVVSTPVSGGAYTRRLGSTAVSAECQLERTGKLVFNAGFAPLTGEQVAVSYRTVGRAVGRAVNAASQQALTQAGSPAVSVWIGTVTNPPARSSADCRNVAVAIAQAAGGVSALWSGSYRDNGQNLGADVWPGDALALHAPSANLTAQVVVRAVKVSYRASTPDLVQYAISFANDWAEDLAIKTSGTVPADAWLPAPVSPTVLANLNNLTVTSLTASAVSINTGVTPPTGGGFEIRRRDFAFAPGEDTGLVMRASVPNMTFSRETANDRFYIRMYDGATPPNYSEFSTALFINLPLGS